MRHLQFDFQVDKEHNTIRVTREFAADMPLVWQAWTTAAILEQWWAPVPFRNQTKSMDFSEGGCWHYAMISPENEMHWCRFDYEEIDKGQRFTGLDAFCDEAGNINTDFSRMHWENVFSQSGASTMVNITISIDSLETLERIIAMGFKEGFTMGLQQLDELLVRLKK